jgi:hypothetical protein
MTCIHTRVTAWAIACDEANRRMIRYNRVKWNRADYNHAVKVLERLLPDPCRD